MRRALFLDRDGTLVHPSHYPSRPEDLVLFDGLGSPLRALQDAGFVLVIVTNQAGIARGYFTEPDLQRMHEYLAGKLHEMGVDLDGIYYCPHHAEGIVPGLNISCRCRKPRPGMLLDAARDLDLDLTASWLLGDILDDVEAGNRAGCRTILVDLGTEAPSPVSVRRPTFMARDILHALQIVAAEEGVGMHGDADVDMAYRPPRWQTEQFSDDVIRLDATGALNALCG